MVKIGKIIYFIIIICIIIMIMASMIIFAKYQQTKGCTLIVWDDGSGRDIKFEGFECKNNQDDGHIFEMCKQLGGIIESYHGLSKKKFSCNIYLNSELKNWTINRLNENCERRLYFEGKMGGCEFNKHLLNFTI